MSAISGISETELRQFLELNYSREQVLSALREKGFSDSDIEQHLKTFRKLRYERQQFNGFILLGTGAFMGFISCVFSIVNPFPEWYHAILYGFTALAIIVIVAGLYLVFEG